MPVRLPNALSIEVALHYTASDFLAAALPSLSKRESAANTILPFALTIRAIEVAARAAVKHASAESCPSRVSQSKFTPARVYSKTAATVMHRGCLWLTCWSTREGESPVLDLVLSCTDGTQGNYPIFLFSSIPPSETTPAFLNPRVTMLVERLLVVIPVKRVFSVFGPASLANKFSENWSEIADVKQERKPVYAATFSYATRETLTAPLPLPSGDCMRQATADDALAVGQLCKEFGDESIHYPLSYERSLQEATDLIGNRQVWVYETREGEIASIVAVTRTSSSVATITKVFTSEALRMRGYGERLVGKVTQEFLHDRGKRRAVLYVGNGNPAAKVYDRIGFVGLESKERPDGVEDWIEIGFREAWRGHW